MTQCLLYFGDKLKEPRAKPYDLMFLVIGTIVLNFPFQLNHKLQDQAHGMFCFENTWCIVRIQLIITESHKQIFL